MEVASEGAMPVVLAVLSVFAVAVEAVVAEAGAVEGSVDERYGFLRTGASVPTFLARLFVLLGLSTQ